MPISSIAQILLRLFALNWFVNGISQFAGGVAFIKSSSDLSYFFPASLVYIIVGVVTWVVAPTLSRLATKNNDQDVVLTGITERQLFSTTFLALGLYFALESFAITLSWLHFFMVHRSDDYQFHQGNEFTYYDLVEAVITLIAGVALMLSCQRWAAKLTRKKEGESPH